MEIDSFSCWLTSFLSLLNKMCLCYSFPEFGYSEEGGVLQDLLKAYDDGDDDAVRTTLSLPLFKYMDNSVSTLLVFLVMVW